ncbi:MAG TPA: zf-HC2 domain-containing protein [Gaiellaceae bacterium]|nr:zf-HC2 domain-containing protein [Gaiellaceae bacterium]
MRLSDYDPDCLKCEEVMQPYLDRVLDDAQVREAEAHLDACDYCRQRYRFEVSLRRYVRTVAAEKQMPVELKAKLAALRTPLQ